MPSSVAQAFHNQPRAYRSLFERCVRTGSAKKSPPMPIHFHLVPTHPRAPPATDSRSGIFSSSLFARRFSDSSVSDATTTVVFEQLLRSTTAFAVEQISSRRVVLSSRSVLSRAARFPAAVSQIRSFSSRNVLPAKAPPVPWICKLQGCAVVWVRSYVLLEVGGHLAVGKLSLKSPQWCYDKLRYRSPARDMILAQVSSKI